jgi:hypothetical protein
MYYRITNKQNIHYTRPEVKYKSANYKMEKRIKYCKRCHNDFSTLYRIQYKNPKEWVFVCEECLLILKKDNSNYKYGGTWKK